MYVLRLFNSPVAVSFNFNEIERKARAAQAIATVWFNGAPLAEYVNGERVRIC